MRRNNKIGLEYFGLHRDMVDRDLSKYYDKIPNQSRSKLLRTYKSIEDYVNILYVLRFVKNLSFKEIKQLLPTKTNVYTRYYDLGWGYEGSFEDNERKHSIELSRLNVIRDRMMNTNLDEPIEKLSHAYMAALWDCNKPTTYNSLGFNTNVDYVNALHYLVNVEELTRNQIALLFDINGSSMYYRLKVIGLNRDHKSAQKNLVKQGRRDYRRIEASSRKTRIAEFLKQGMFGTGQENAVRSLLDIMLPEYLDVSRYDVVVGVNTRNIVREVDIPVVIIEVMSNKIFKFAIEYNLDVHHGGDRDVEKKLMLNTRGWTYIPITVRSELNNRENEAAVQGQLKDVCREIQRTVTRI